MKMPPATLLWRGLSHQHQGRQQDEPYRAAGQGLNDSAIHEDVMIGAPDTNVIGTTKDGKEVTIFTNGEWAF